MSNIVWILGSSAVGKETFIRKMIGNNDLKIIEKLGWKNKEINFIEESIKYIGQYRNDPIIYRRDEILDRVVEKVEGNNDKVILIKGQVVDLKNKRLNKLRELLPEHRHEILFLHADLNILYERCKSKNWWNKKDGIEVVRKWLVNHQIKRINKLDDFPIRAVDTGGDEYKLIMYPPRIEEEFKVDSFINKVKKKYQKTKKTYR
ncbi:hypothetical protein [Oceanirhabdus sp. W0125-5]|uniref:hypothetical protein n=1 Tax=Oceanirhabdus sp. W0125-5 TaxID=2999116 RepID=UPI0022F2D7D4|nr:hypothetical protein [Oceanirhabdus sp. W0125-5]WBW98615.1 hypothetical protein OW730_07625 [Oceanirhabdus sp. W0125-5]